jgi:diguanylate cyclase (GGDEF)-like protein
MLTALALFNLMLFALLRKASYLLFSLALLAMISYNVVRATTWEKLWPGLFVLDTVPAYLAYVLFFGLLIAFAREFLELPRISNRLHAVLYAAFGCLVLDAVLYSQAPGMLAARGIYSALEPIVVLILMGTLLVAGMVAHQRGVQAARYYNVAFAGAAVGIVVAASLDHALLAPAWSDVWSAGGIVWAALFLGLALVERIRGAEQQAAQLGEFAYRDQLTAIPNRRAFDEVLDREWRRALRNSSELSLVMFDIDHFKAYNDKFGHQRGDECLRQVAGEIGDAAKRAGDFAARYGGEEFAIVLAHTGIEGAQTMAETVRQAVRRRNIAFGEGPVTISGGCATFVPADWQSAGDLIAAADAALYIAKATGRDRVVTS